MPLVKETVILGIDDAKVYKLTADTAAALTYTTGIDVPGITGMSVSPNFVEKELKGDESILDFYSKLESLDWSFTNALLSLDVLAILLGGAVAATGVTPNMKQTYSLLKTDTPSYFKLEGKSDYADVGDVHVILYKCKASKVDYELKGEDYAVVSASGKAIGTIYDGKVKDIVYNETAVSIAVTTDIAPPTISATVPADGAAAIDKTADLTVTFSEAIQAGDANDDHFILTTAAGVAVATTITINSPTNTIVTINPDAALGGTTDYLLIITGVHDTAGNVLAAPTVVNFTTAA